jgi:prolipoprotein diacylglyceryltransferase
MAQKKSAPKKSSDSLTRRDVALLAHDLWFQSELVLAMMQNRTTNPVLLRRQARKLIQMGAPLVELGKSAGRWRNFITAQILLLELEYAVTRNTSTTYKFIKTVADYVNGDPLLR